MEKRKKIFMSNCLGEDIIISRLVGGPQYYAEDSGVTAHNNLHEKITALEKKVFHREVSCVIKTSME